MLSRAPDAFAEAAPRAPVRPPAGWSPRAGRSVAAVLPLLVGCCLLLPRFIPTALSVPAAAAVAAALVVVCGLALLLPAVLARLGGARLALGEADGPLGLLVAATLIGVALTGGSASPALPWILALTTALGAFVPARRLFVLLVGTTLATALALIGASDPTVALAQAGTAAAATALATMGFGMLGRALFFGTLKAVKVREEARIDGELLRMYDDARLFRLLGREESASLAPTRADPARTGDGRGTEELRLLAQTLAVRDGCYRALRLAARALRPDACALYIVDSSGKELVLKEQLLEVEGTCQPRVSAAAGGLGLAVKRKQAIRLLDSEGPGTQVHRRGAKSLLVTPWLEHGEVRGLFVADRNRPEIFTEDDETFATALVEEIAQHLRTERVLSDLDIDRQRKARIFAAARAFGGVVRAADAVDTTLRVALELVPGASAAVVDVVRDVESGRQAMRVAKAAGPLASALTAREAVALSDEAWVGRALLSHTVLPHVHLAGLTAEMGRDRGLFDADDGRTQRLGDLRVFPLLANAETVGALVVATNQGDRIRVAALDALAVVADLAGIAVAGARLFESALKQATTDGLTGLANRRTLDARMQEALARAGRTSVPLSVLLTDVDHFKSVNDTYGHSVGDEVLQGVARALAKTARVSDVVARYGGEEFCLVLEGTDGPGAARLAERMRVAVKNLVFQTEKGPLSVTASFGVAVLEKDDDPRALVERADANLYRAKQKGRDRVVAP